MTEQARRKKIRKKFLSKKKRLGLCRDCSNPSTPGMTSCQDCRTKNNRAVRNRLDRLMAEGLCRKCGAIPKGKFSHCQPCRIEMSRTSIKEEMEIPFSRSDAHLPQDNQYTRLKEVLAYE